MQLLCLNSIWKGFFFQLFEFPFCLWWQIQDVQKEGEEKSKEEQNQDDIQDEENGIEMSEDFEGKLHDLEQQGKIDENDLT